MPSPVDQDQIRPCQSPSLHVPADWFAKPGTDACEVAKSACYQCPLVRACGRQALSEGIPFGVWGGLDGTDRKVAWQDRELYPSGRPDTFQRIIETWTSHRFRDVVDGEAA